MRTSAGERKVTVRSYQNIPYLEVHNPDFPTPEELKSKIRIGDVEFDGDITRDSPGSDLI